MKFVEYNIHGDKTAASGVGTATNDDVGDDDDDDAATYSTVPHTSSSFN